jgi:hypothetical protein
MVRYEAAGRKVLQEGATLRLAEAEQDVQSDVGDESEWRPLKAHAAEDALNDSERVCHELLGVGD